MQSATGKKTSKKNSTRSKERTNSDSGICFRAEQNYTNSIPPSTTQNDDCKSIYTVVRKLSKLVLKNKTKVVCWTNKKMNCKECYCVCCDVKSKDKLLSTKTPPWNEGNQA